MDLSSLQAAVDRFDSASKTTGELNARLSAVEQMVASANQSASGLFLPGNAGAGTEVLSQLAENPLFQSASRATARGMAAGRFDVRTDLGLTIRAALTSDGAGSSAPAWRSPPEQGGIAPQVFRPLQLLDYLPHRTTSRDAVEFARLSSTGDADYQEEQGTEKPEIVFAGEVARAEIATIAGWMAASTQVLADNEQLRAVIDGVLRSKVLARLEHQIINGDGGVGHIEGLLSQAIAWPMLNVVVAGETISDRIGMSVAMMRAGGYSPNLLVLSPEMWFCVQTLKSNTEGLYLFGSPMAPLAASIWNIPVVLSSALPTTRALLIDTAFVTVLDREQATVTLSNSHADFFTRNLVAILCELRAGLEVLDQSAVCSLDLSGFADPDLGSSEPSSEPSSEE